MFLHLPDGGLAGLWLKDDRDGNTAPFVHMDSEAGFRILAPNFLLFLDRVTKRAFEDEYSDGDFLSAAFTEPDDDETPSDLTDLLKSWIDDHHLVDKEILADAPTDYSDVDNGSAQEWLEALFADIDAKENKRPD